MSRFNSVIKSRIEIILSKILSDKYNAKVRIKFRKRGRQNGDCTEAGNIKEKQIPYK